MIDNKYYAAQNTPNTVSADRPTTDRSFVSVVGQSGKPVLDFEFNLAQDIHTQLRQLAQPLPSGFLLGQSRRDTFEDFTFPAPGATPADSFRMNRITAMVGGFPVVVEYTDTTDPGQNTIQLTAAPLLGGTAPDVKRTDFVFLEVWPALVGASPAAVGTVQIPDIGLITAGVDTVTVAGTALLAVAGVPGANEFQVGGSEAATATNLAAAINASAAGASVTAASFGTDTVRVLADTRGTAGNAITLATSNAAAFVLSGPTLAGGADRPNKPTQETLYRHGNVLSPLGVALPDDMWDPIVGQETAQRVQLQYRIRVTGQTEAVNYKSQPDGFSNSAVLAQGGESAPVAGYPFVPADTASTLASSSAVAYGVRDSGLWIAGDGSSTAAAALQSLSGFVLAIPICFVYRRNDAYLGGAGAGFDPVSNTQGALPYTHPGFANPAIGAIPAGESDRVDGAFHDVIVAPDVLDLRRHVAPAGYDMTAELAYQLQSLMDGQNSTWAIDTTSKQELGGGSGNVSTRFLVCNEIGRDAGHGGNGSTSGDTPRGVTIRNFDHVARRFGDQPVVERVVFELYSQDRDSGIVNAPGRLDPGKYVEKNPAVATDVGWYEGDKIHIDLFALNATSDGTFDPGQITLAGAYIADFAPPGAVITDVISIRHDDGNWNSAVSQDVQATTIEGLGTNHIIITLDSNPTEVTGGLDVAAYPMVGDGTAGDVGSPRRIFVELEYTYPKGVGLTDTPDEVLTPPSTPYPYGPLIENVAPGLRPADMEEPLVPQFREGFRETMLEYIASENGGGSPIGSVTTETFVSVDPSTVQFLRRLYGSATHQVTVTDQETTAAATVNVSTTEYGSSSRLLRLVGALSGAGQTQVAVTYFAQDSIPNYGGAGGGYQVSIYYRSRAPQTVGVKEGVVYTPAGVLPTQLNVEPLAIARDVWTTQIGSGSTERGFPYAFASDFIPINDGGVSSSTPEWYMCASAQISIADFSADTGMLNLHAFIPVDGTGTFSFGDGSNPPKVDLEFRAFYDFADDTVYRPTAMAQPLSNAARHKSFTAMLVRALDDSLLFRRGEVLVIVLSRFAELDAENTVRFQDTDNRTCAAVYRTRNLLLISE